MSFWAFAKRRAQDGGEETVLRIDGVIGPGEGGVDWFGDVVVGSTAFNRALCDHAGDLTVEINSPGGDVFAGVDMYAALCRHRGRVSVRVSWAASMASIIAQAAAPGALEIVPGGMMMIHEPWSAVQGNAGEMEREAEVLREITDGMVGIYMQRYRGTEQELREALAREEYLSAERAVACGLCDRVAEIVPGMNACSAQRICALASDDAMARWREAAKAAPGATDAAAQRIAEIVREAAELSRRHARRE